MSKTLQEIYAAMVAHQDACSDLAERMEDHVGSPPWTGMRAEWQARTTYLAISADDLVTMLKPHIPVTETPPPEVEVINLPGLRAALKVIERHRDLMLHAAKDSSVSQDDMADALRLVPWAIRRIVNENFR